MTTKPYTLVLDISYRPVIFTPGSKAFVLVLQQRGVLLESYPNSIFTLKTVNKEYSVPAVIRLNVLHKHFVGQPSRMAIFYRDMFTCVYCGKVCKDHELTIDHVVPKSRGGKWSWKNLVTCCTDCNQKKGNKTPQESGLKLLHKPYKPDKFEIALLKYHKYLHPWFKQNCLPMWINKNILKKFTVLK